MPGDGKAEYRPTIKEMPDGERPRERLQRCGPAALSNAELLAIVLRTGVKGENVINMATRLLVDYRGLSGLSRAGFDELCDFRGLGPAKAAQLKAALELGRRLLLESPDDRPQISTPADAANLLLLEMGPLPQEQMRVLLLDTKNRLLAAPTVYQGSLNVSVVRIAELFREAIKRNCASIIVAHNHPSGDPTPSPEDVEITGQIAQAGKLLGIELLDHLIIGDNRYLSLRERGLGFS